MKHQGFATAAILVAMAVASPGVARRAIGVHVEVPLGGIRGEPVRVYYPPDPDQPLNLRFSWTAVKARRHDDWDAWVAYECRSVFPPNRVHATAGMWPSKDRLPRPRKGVVLHSTRDRSRNPEAPDIVVLLRVRATPGSEWSVLWAMGRTPNLEFDPVHLPVHWIGAADPEESIALLEWLGSYAASPEAREQLVNVIAVHGDSAITVSHLSEIVAGDHPANVRSAAAAGLAWHSPPAVIGGLTAPGDRSKTAER